MVGDFLGEPPEPAVHFAGGVLGAHLLIIFYCPRRIFQIFEKMPRSKVLMIYSPRNRTKSWAVLISTVISFVVSPVFLFW